MNEPLSIVPGASDADRAADFKKRAIDLYGPILELCTEAEKFGFELQIQSGKGPLGKHTITRLAVVKVY